MEEGNEGEGRRTESRRAHLLGFVIVSAVAVIALAMVGAPPLLILEVFGLAIVLGASAIAIIIVFGGRQRVHR